LIPKEQKKKLKETYGDNWLEKVNGMYAQIERDIHDQTVGKFAKLRVPSFEGFIMRGLSFLLGHKQFGKNDFKKIHDRVYNDFYKKGSKSMMCSEFVTHTTIAALYELNEQLKKDILDKPKLENIEPPPSPDKQKLGNIKSPSDPGQIVKIPFEYENLERVHPDRLLKVLKKSGCIEEKRVTVPFLKNIIKEEELKEVKINEDDNSSCSFSNKR